MAATLDILKKLGGNAASESGAENAQLQTDIEPAPNLMLSPQLTQQPDMKLTLAEILTQSNQLSPDWKD